MKHWRYKNRRKKGWRCIEPEMAGRENSPLLATRGEVLTETHDDSLVSVQCDRYQKPSPTGTTDTQ